MYKPMLAAQFREDKLVFPLIVQRKLDGIRASVVGGQLVSRTLKPIPNRYIRSLLSQSDLEGFDGELIVGDPTDPDCLRKTTSAVMSEDGTPDFAWYVFDLWNERPTIAPHKRHNGFIVPPTQGARPNLWGYRKRWRELNSLATHASRWIPQIKVLDYCEILDRAGLDNREAAWVAEGFEGVILRNPDSPYKFGRGSATKFDLIKLKRFEDFEAMVVSVEEEMSNQNEAKTNALGRTERSTAKAGKVGKGTLGKLICQRFTLEPDTGDVLLYGESFGVGTGFSRDERRDLWQERPVGKIAKLKSFPVGEYERPRLPVFLGWRDRSDI